MTAKERIDQLRAELHRHNYNYYILNAPEISDKEFDDLMRELQDLEKEHPEYDDPNSPTQRVGSDINKDIIMRRFSMGGQVRAAVVFFDGMANANQINDFISQMRCTGNNQFHLSGAQTAENVFHGSLRAMLQIIFQQMGGFNGPAVLR